MHTVGVPNLRVMPSGPLPPNPPELLDSKVVERLLHYVAGSGADVVILDAPPMLGLSDTSILASKVDGTLVVVDTTHAKKDNLQQVKTLLSQTGTRVLGSVVNKQPRKRRHAVYDYYGYPSSKHRSNGKHRHFKKGRSIAGMSNSIIPISLDHQRNSQVK